ncbi:protein kinase domain-containing protein [Saccharothrix coeruleofusca]|uniref:protein kinase domain-containing protein n=1 Tax=Saccharothrix coeruleofusca TaxID=33919 RepID=UPI001FD1788B|nr:LCP family protein [Saccharothrix coeruleofusca]
MSHPEVPGYAVVGLAGRGGFAVVYRALQVSVDREVALKVDSRMVLDEADRRRFLREAKAAGRLSGHPHVVGLHDAGVLADGRPYLVMELCTGGSLLDRLRTGGPMSPARVRELGVRIADALAAAHAAGVLHRDIKPANILVNRYGVPGLADFGLAALAEPGRDSSASLSALTPAYAAPEAFRQEQPTERADVYSLGATLYALLSGRPPRFPRVGDPNLAEIILLHGKPVPPVAGVPDEMMAVLRKALANDPAQRYATAALFRDALSALDITPDTTAESTPDDTPDGAPGGTTAATRDSTEVVDPDPPAPTTHFGFGPKRDEQLTLGRVVTPDPADDVTAHVATHVAAGPPADRPARRRAGRVLGRVGRVVVALAAVAVLVSAGIAWWVLSGVDEQVKVPGVLDVPGSPDSADGMTDLLLVGSDSRTDAEGRPLPDDVLRQLRTEQSAGVNTDSAILVRLSEGGGRAAAVSIPRDLRVPLPDAGEGSISEVFGVGKQRAEAELRASGVVDEQRLARESDTAGRRLLVQVVQQLTGVRVDRYAELNLYGFYLLSQAVGGVEVCLKADVADPGSGAVFKAGPQSVSGSDALSFLRQRQGLPRGDLDRIARQQAFLGALIDKITSAGTLTDPAAVSDLVAAVKRTMVVDSGSDLLDLAGRLREVAAGDVDFLVLPVQAAAGGPEGAVTADPATVRAFINGLRTAKPGSGPAAAPNPVPAAPPCVD